MRLLGITASALWKHGAIDKQSNDNSTANPLCPTYSLCRYTPIRAYDYQLTHIHTYYFTYLPLQRAHTWTIVVGIFALLYLSVASFCFFLSLSSSLNILLLQPSLVPPPLFLVPLVRGSRSEPR